MFFGVMRTLLRSFVVGLYFCFQFPAAARADAISDNPIVFVTMVPNPADFGTLAATFGNHVANPNTAFRGGDLWIRYPNGALKNLTSTAGYGVSGQQGATAIAVRDPAVHWDGTKVIFSMVIGAPTQQYQLTSHRWQLYEITGLGQNENPVITKVPNQPEEFNNHSAVYGSDNSIIFISDRPRDSSVLHTYPQRDEYESSPVNSGLWKIVAGSGELKILDHAPSGDFNPIVDSFGRIIMTRWDHLQRDQQNVGVPSGAFNFASEVSTQQLSSAPEVFPEPRSVLDDDYQATINVFTINQFFPWMANQDGTGLETLNHVGRQEIGVYSNRSFNDDSSLEEFSAGQYPTGANQNSFDIFLHIKEKPTQAGVYLGTSCQEFGTHAAGQILSITGAPGVNPDDMVVQNLTHPDTSGATDSPSADHSGLYRDPLPLSNGKLVAAHTANTRADANIGSGNNPLSRYDFRLKLLTQSGPYFGPSTLLTTGISKSVSFWDPDKLVSYSGLLWEMMPVELKATTRPTASTQELPAVETGTLSSLGVELAELQEFLREQNLALVISRNVTMRDRNDRQQPISLRVSGGGAETIPNDSKIYDIAFMQFMQGDLIRGYDNGNRDGRRVIAQPMHSVTEGVNPSVSGAPTGAVRIAADGSMAAFVPAGRALSWQSTDADGVPVVRERYWLTFQPGEVRVCASCHGINTADHLGNPEPDNVPQALTELLSHWKDLPYLPPASGYSLTVSSRLKAGKKFTLNAAGGSSSASLAIRVKVGGKRCMGAKALSTGSTSRSLRGKFPALAGLPVQFNLTVRGSKSVLSTKKVTLRGKKLKYGAVALGQACSALMKSLK